MLAARTVYFGRVFLGLIAGVGSGALAQGVCGLDSRNIHNVVLPEIGESAMGTTQAAEIRRGYELISVGHASVEGAKVLEQARTETRAAPNPCGEGLAEFGLGQVARTQKLPEALPHLLRAEELLKSIATPLALAYVHASIATTKRTLGDNEAFLLAAPQTETELREAGDPAAAILLQSLVLQSTATSLQPEQQGALAHELEGISTPNVVGVRGYVQWAWGSALRRTGRYAEIAGHFQASLAALTECQCEPATHAAVLLNMAAAADASGDAETVLRFATQADAIYRENHYESLRPQSMRLMAAAYAHRHDWPRALAKYDRALQLAREQHVVAALPDIGLEYGAAYGDSGHPLKGLAMIAETMPTKPTARQQCSLQAQRMVLEHQAAQYEAAATDAEKVMKECREFLQPSTVAVVASRYADIDLRQGRSEAGVEHAREAVAIVDTQRSRVQPNDNSIAEFNEHQTSAYTVLIRALLFAGKPEEALLASEQDRARAFVDLAATPQPAGPRSNVADPTMPQMVRGPVGPRSEVHPFTLTAADIRTRMDAQRSTLISYWIGDDRLYTWVMAPGKPVVEKDQPLQREQLTALVRATLPGEGVTATRRGDATPAKVRTRGGASQSVTRSSRAPWAELYRLLIAPVAAELPADTGSQLTIVPQGPLFQLSFPALVDSKNRYLVERYAVNTAPSAGVLEVTAKNEVTASALPARYVVLANPERFPVVNGAALPPLPGTEAEAHGIARQLDGKQVTMLEGRQAGVSSFAATLPAATMLHLATHAVVSDTAPSTSFLAMDSRQEGGKLTAAAVYGLHLHANLVVLSACSTGRGKISGDGVAGLSRAFFYAGAASLVTTLWDVVDEPTAQLMPKFYAGLARGESRSAALRGAQLGLIRDLRAHRVQVETLAGGHVSLPESPAYWAAFSLSGQP